jgi:transposase InsO family protein
MRELNRRHLTELSPEARLRLAWFDFYCQSGENASRTCEVFRISRSTFYYWKKRYKPFDLGSLEDRSSRPKHCRQKSWTTDEILAVKALRERYPRWGKAKLAVLLKRAGKLLSVSKVGRILSYLKRTGKLQEPLRRSLGHKRPWKRPYATKMPKGYLVRAPGDLVQMDTTEIRPGPGVILKQFTTIDCVSRYAVPTIASNATATLARRGLEALIDRSPFPIKAIQVDRGSEFMAVFEEACKTRGIYLFELPPHSPKLNGRVERANRTFKEEFYDCSNATPTVAGFKDDLRQWEDVYNTIRPHQALGYLTPVEFLATHFPTIIQKEVLSDRS